MLVGVDYVNSIAGTNCGEEEVIELLTRMSLTSTVADKGTKISPNKAFGAYTPTPPFFPSLLVPFCQLECALRRFFFNFRYKQFALCVYSSDAT